MTQKLGCIYLIRNTVNGMCYVGQSVNNPPKDRIACQLSNGGSYILGGVRHEHQGSSQNPLIYEDIKKHGKDVFEWEILHENVADTDLDDLEAKEIAERKTFHPDGYNQSRGVTRLAIWTHNPELRKEMTKEKRIPFSFYAHPPVQLHEILNDHDCGSQRNLLVTDALFKMIDRDIVDHTGTYIGITRIISHTKLGERCFMSERNIRYAVDELEDKGIISKEKAGKCFRYHILIYQTAINYLASNPDHPHEKLTSPIPPADKVNAVYAEVAKTGNNSANDSQNSAESADSIESISIDKETPVSQRSTGTRGSDERGGDSLNQKQEAVLDKFDAEAIDVMPSHEIGEVIDTLTEEKGRAKEKDNTVESLVKAIRPDDVVVEWKHQQSASLLQETIINKLSAAGIDMPPVLFFCKYCVDETDNRVADGKIDVRPSSPNFYLNTPQGKDIIDYCINQVKSENARDNDIERTKARLDKQKNFKREGIPPAAQAMMDELLGREDTTDI